MNLLNKQLTVKGLAEIVYLQALEIERLRNYCAKTYATKDELTGKADKSEVLFYRRADGNISLKEK